MNSVDVTKRRQVNWATDIYLGSDNYYVLDENNK